MIEDFGLLIAPARRKQRAGGRETVFQMFQKIKFQRTNVQITNKYQYSMSKINSFQHFGI
jgi:hypothetical protein